MEVKSGDFRNLMAKEGLKIHRRQRRADQITLHLGATFRSQPIELRLSFNPLRGGNHSESARQMDQSAHNDHRTLTGAKILHEGAYFDALAGQSVLFPETCRMPRGDRYKMNGPGKSRRALPIRSLAAGPAAAPLGAWLTDEVCCLVAPIRLKAAP
jgi:hypothetical protein